MVSILWARRNLSISNSMLGFPTIDSMVLPGNLVDPIRASTIALIFLYIRRIVFQKIIPIINNLFDCRRYFVYIFKCLWWSYNLGGDDYILKHFSIGADTFLITNLSLIEGALKRTAFISISYLVLIKGLQI